MNFDEYKKISFAEDPELYKEYKALGDSFTADGYVFHAVTERPMFMGQTIIFNEENHSGVYNRVMTCKRMLDGEKIDGDLAEYIKSNLDKCTKITYRELALEKVRREEYPHYPSRMACLYTSRDFEEAEKWANYFKKLGREVFSIVKLRIDGNIFDGDACNCFDGTEIESENIEKARRYWKMDMLNEKPIIEILVSGNIFVEEIIADYKKDT